ncbi:hypothetical protein BJY04DRAFT_40010 [Aspergillus karnatakaensis]|uniref:uncharacterized protein n=1 Tax=Aspergillus karnatakaensis TaxID=1810916 RepID=UPI003CCCD74E
MRLCVNRLQLSSFAVHCRRFHHAHLRAKDPEIFEDSLEKTLEEHRSTNRQNLIRKVYTRPKVSKAQPELPVTQDTRTDAVKSQPALPNSQGPVRKIQARSFLKGISHSPPYIPRKESLVDVQPDLRGVGHPIRWGGCKKHLSWLSKMAEGVTYPDGLSQLDAELRALDRLLTPTAEEDTVIHGIAMEITGHLSKLQPSNGYHIIGSRCAGYAMSSSDLNILVTMPDVVRPNIGRGPSASRPKRLRLYRKFLHQIKISLQDLNGYQTYIHEGRRIDVYHEATKLKITLDCGEELPSALEHILSFHAEYPVLRPIYMAVRLILESLGRFQGVVDSEVLHYLITAFLRVNHGRFQRDTACAEAFIAFLRTFGELDYTTTGVAVDPPGFFTADSLKEECAQYADNSKDIPAHLRGQRALLAAKKTALERGIHKVIHRLCLQDPTRYLTDVGVTCTRTPDMKRIFKRAHERLTCGLEAWTPGRLDSSRPVVVTTETSLLYRVLKVEFTDFKQRRKKILDYGVAPPAKTSDDPTTEAAAKPA